MKDQKESFSGPSTDALKNAREYGIDTGQLEFLLTLSPAERLRLHDIARPLIIAARQAGIHYYGFDPGLAGTAE
jgi:hypothetical protein